MDLSNNYIFNHSTRVRIDDINFGYHLCHSKFINLIHNTRALFLKNHSLSETDCYGSGMVMLKLNIDYRGQCYFDDLLEVQLTIERLDKAAILLNYTIINHTSNKVAANASTLMGFIDIKNGKLRRTPPDFANLINGIYYNKHNE